jgi:hypothetical protein
MSMIAPLSVEGGLSFCRKHRGACTMQLSCSWVRGRWIQFYCIYIEEQENAGEASEKTLAR